ncbi:hypothetical protein [Anaerosolibacter sp.]|uniref:hypothetical protein n=1 Tax=Anaerosolibacter sp. TaxID=1872527 RepID=UPI0039EE2AB0
MTSFADARDNKIHSLTLEYLRLATSVQNLTPTEFVQKYDDIHAEIEEFFKARDAKMADETFKKFGF